MWIGVIADTRGELNPKVHQIFQGMDYILHCGGIGSPAVLDELSNISPISGVIGEGDTELDYPFKSILFRKDWGIPLLVRYKVGTPSRPLAVVSGLIEENDPKVLLFGAQEEAFNAAVSNRLWFSPGLATTQDGSDPASVGILEIDGQIARGEVIPL